MRVRLQKFLAAAGVASRRASERLIVEGRVTVNGLTVQQLGTTVDPDHDKVSVDGQPLRPRRKVYVALHKPPGFICTRSDPAGRDTIFDLLPLEWRHLYPVGRLDRESEGLLFLTSDGDFCLRLTHPRYSIRKTYIATVEGRLTPAHLARLTEGITDSGEKLKAQHAQLISSNNKHSMVELELTEGKYREIRRLFAALNFKVVRLQRTRIGPVRLGELKPGKWRMLTEPEIKSLLKPK
jgi:pseudouridine synthase